jgi:excisionase family DNA binding protein
MSDRPDRRRSGGDQLELFAKTDDFAGPLPSEQEERSGSRPRRWEPEPLVLSVREAAALLGISKDLAYELVARGELPALRLGGRIVIPRNRLFELVT